MEIVVSNVVVGLPPGTAYVFQVTAIIRS
jgi:hypothetical protein